MALISLGEALGPVAKKLSKMEATYWYREARKHGPKWWQQKKQSLIVEYGQQRVDELVKEMERLRQRDKQSPNTKPYQGETR